MSRPVKTGIPLFADRRAPKLAADAARLMEQSGVVDDLYLWDQLVGWWPNALWTTENAPLAQVMPDCDAFPDPFVLAGLSVAHTDGLGVAIGTDAIRRGPAELAQTMLTLAGATGGRATLLVGAGEAKQARPFGYKRAEGLARLEDILQLYRRLTSAEGPFDFQGNHWNVKSGWVGSPGPYTPKIWAMGGGPQLLDLAARYADGFVTAVPSTFSRPEDYAANVATLKQALERHGRDPEAFDFGIIAPSLIHDDRDIIEKSFHNPLVRIFAATFGRLNQAEWEALGIAPVLPVDWHYAMKYIPTEWTAQDAYAITDKVTVEMVGHSFFLGTPTDVADGLRAFTEAGATWIAPCDFLLPLLRLDDAAAALPRSLEVCRRLKEK